MTVFWEPEDFERYLELLGEGSRRYGLRIWAYCLMPNHVHLIARPEVAESMSRALQWIHAQYARAVNRRREWTGHLWQQRYYSAPMDWQQVPWAMRYVLRNPVRAGLVEHAVDWPWSSAAAHCGLRADDRLANDRLLAGLGDLVGELELPETEARLELMRRSTRTGIAIGSREFRAELEARFGLPMAPRRPGRPPKPSLPSGSIGCGRPGEPAEIASD